MKLNYQNQIIMASYSNQQASHRSWAIKQPEGFMNLSQVPITRQFEHYHLPLQVNSAKNHHHISQ